MTPASVSGTVMFSISRVARQCESSRTARLPWAILFATFSVKATPYFTIGLLPNHSFSKIFRA